MGNCKDCRFWTRGECDLVDISEERDIYGAAENVENVDFAINVTADDDQGLSVSFRTGPDFGCVRFQAKG